jgi:CheY-like chemotaxis protein
VTPSDAAESDSPLDGDAGSAIVVKFHETTHDGTQQHFADEADDISIIASGADERAVDLVLWAPSEIDDSALRAVIDQHRPIPVFVVLDASRQPGDISRCLGAGAIQCLIDPADAVLIANIHAIVRRLRARL